MNKVAILMRKDQLFLSDFLTDTAHITLLGKNAVFRTFWKFQPGYEANPQSTQKGICNMTACLSFH